LLKTVVANKQINATRFEQNEKQGEIMTPNELEEKLHGLTAAIRSVEKITGALVL
jgi:hypothetical protein